ncbi:MAG: hypothetical protein NZ532_09425, partial [Thermoflexales bacterium]|nr:hypothetical protein [Thermoflexales bacterium]
MGTVTLSLGGAGEDNNQQGDLDLSLPPTITTLLIGGGPNGVTIEVDQSLFDDRLFDVQLSGGQVVTFANLVLTGGAAPSSDTSRTVCNLGSGGAIRAVGSGGETLSLISVTVRTNTAVFRGGGVCAEGVSTLIASSVVT